jgi:hypothetical protein
MPTESSLFFDTILVWSSLKLLSAFLLDLSFFDYQPYDFAFTGIALEHRRQHFVYDSNGLESISSILLPILVPNGHLFHKSVHNVQETMNTLDFFQINAHIPSLSEF